MTIYKDIDDLVKRYIEDNVFLTVEDIKRIGECEMVIEDIIPSGKYIEFKNGMIIVP